MGKAYPSGGNAMQEWQRSQQRNLAETLHREQNVWASSAMRDTAAQLGGIRLGGHSRPRTCEYCGSSNPTRNNCANCGAP